MANKGKHTDNIEMSFTDPVKPESAAAPTAATEDIEEFKENGQLVYQKNKKSGDVKFFIQEDGKDVEVSLDIIDKLEKAYPVMPDRNYSGSKKKGETKVRYTKEQFNEEKLGMETVEVSPEECDLITERQDYEDGDAITNTIVKKHLNIVKFLRGEIGG